MADYRLYFLDTESHVIGRSEFAASGDDFALRIVALLTAAMSGTYAGYMLWQGNRQIFATDRGGDRAFMRALAARPLSHDEEQIVLSLKELLLNSHWFIARSKSRPEPASRPQERAKICELRMPRTVTSFAAAPYGPLALRALELPSPNASAGMDALECVGVGKADEYCFHEDF